jgi:hypothetical protein
VPIKQNEQPNKHLTSHLNTEVHFAVQIPWHDIQEYLSHIWYVFDFKKRRRYYRRTECQ